MLITPSKIFTVSCLSFIGGIFIYSFVPSPIMLTAVFIFIGLIALVGLFPFGARWGSRRWLSVAVAFSVLAFAFSAIVMSFAKDEQNIKLRAITPFFDDKIVLRGTVDNYPDVRLSNAHLIINVESIDGNNLLEQEMGGILVYADRFYDYSYGDKLQLEGILRYPQPFNGFDYPSFLAKDGIFAVMSKPEITVLKENNGNMVSVFLFKARSSLDKSIMSVMPFKEAAVLKAILLGDEGAMTEEFKTKLNQAGLRHIVAISGMNITLIAAIFMTAFLKMGLWRRQAFVVTLGVIGIFVAMIGAPASATRAAIFGVLMRFQETLGRLSSAFNVTLFAAVIMIALNPFSLRWDLGFQLSFLAVLGLIFFTPMFTRLFNFIPEKFFIRDTLAMTFAAQITTFPLLVASFNSFSLITPLSNILVVPLLPIVTTFGFLLAILNFFIPVLAVICAIPLLMIIKFIYFIASILGSITPLSIYTGQVAELFFGAIYALVLIVLIRREKKIKKWPIDEFREFSKVHER